MFSRPSDSMSRVIRRKLAITSFGSDSISEQTFPSSRWTDHRMNAEYIFFAIIASAGSDGARRPSYSASVPRKAISAARSFSDIFSGFSSEWPDTLAGART